MKHKVVQSDNLLYTGCEPHWHCKQCGGYWPFHCYTKEQIESIECPMTKTCSKTKIILESENTENDKENS